MFIKRYFSMFNKHCYLVIWLLLNQFLKNRCLNVFSTLLYNNNKTAAFIFHFISNSLTVSSLECLLKIEKILLNKRSNIMFYINIL